MRLRNLSPLEKSTAILLLISALFDGVIMSLNQTQDIIARKALLAQDWQLMLMTMLWPVTNFFSIWWGRVYERSHHKHRYFLIAGIFGRLTMAYALWLTTMNEYLVILGLLYASNSLLLPARNSIYQRNIHYQRRARFFGTTISLGMAVSIVFTFVAGRLLDSHEQMFRWILLITGVCGFISSAVMSLIRTQDPEGERTRKPLNLKQTLMDPIHGTFKLLKENLGFAKFERSFSIYGMGFIMMQPIIPIYLVDRLHLSYTLNFLAKGILSQVGMLLLSPFFGRLHDRMHPFKFISIAFGLLMLFPTLMVVSSLLQGSQVLPVVLVFVAYLIFGIAMTAVNMAWNMGSIYFAGEQDASIFQSVHVTMTGIRGLIAPVLGFAVLRILNLTMVFVVAAGFLLTASLVSYQDYRKLLRIPPNSTVVDI